MTKSNSESAQTAVIAFLSLVVFALLLGLTSSISSYDLDKQSELSSRCKSLGGVVGQNKCFKNGKEV